MINQQKNARFRELLNKPGILSIPVIYDCMSALLAQRAGFEIVVMGGNATVASMLGYPDIGLATGTEMTARAGQIAKRLSVPLYCDADNGYGNVNNARRAVIDFEDAGVSGIHLEDQAFPKRCGFLCKPTLIAEQEAVEKLQVALKARRDPNFVIIGRTDAAGAYDIDESIRRLKLFEQVGVDLLMPCCVQSKEDLLKVAKAFPNTPLIADIEDGNPDMAFTDKELEGMGFKISTRPLTAGRVIWQKAAEMYAYYRKNGHLGPYVNEALPMNEYEELLKVKDEFDILEWAKK